MDTENLERSMRRTQAEIRDIIDCNPFEWFGTFTFSPDKVDRKDDEKIYSIMSKWLNNQRRTSPNLQYLLVPERHKDGALHFHALLGRFEGVLSDSGRKWQGQPIFNVKSYTAGFSNFTRIRDKQKTANYCRKYITKELMVERSKRRYWRSTNLNTPERVDNLELANLIQTYPVDIYKATEYQNDHITRTTLPLIGK